MLTRLLLFFFLIINTVAFTQDYTQTVRGRVVDAISQEALIGATVQLVETDFATTTDTLGRYRLENIPVGRYQLVVNYLGYAKIRIPELLVETGKEVVRQIELRPTTADLDEVVVRAERERIIHPVSTRTITVEETRRFPATFFDPARLAASYAGVVNANDQANALIIRGNSPASNNWQIAGAEIVNPNHTPNAGTFSDRPTFTGGGVNILSAQMLDNSTLLTGAFPVQYGNALGGILDMNFRDGNNEKYEFTGQLGLIGIDLAAEGPFSKKGDASFLVNYRYSTIGLLGALGVPLGDEEINFQDLAVNVSLPTKKLGKFTLFGMGGMSENIFAAPRDTSEIEEEKDRMDIEFDSRMGAVGITHQINFGQKWNWRSTGILSTLTADRNAATLNADFLPTFHSERDEIDQDKLSFFSEIAFQANARQRFSLGISTTQQFFDHYSEVLDSLPQRIEANSFSPRFRALRPFVQWNGRLAERWQVNVGLGTQLYFFDGAFLNDEGFISSFFSREEAISYFEPRLSLTYILNQKQRISLAYGMHSQFRSPYLRTTVLRIGETVADDPVFNRAQHLVLNYQWGLADDLQLEAELYWQELDFTPFVPFTDDFVQEVDARDLILYAESGHNYGLELSLQKYITNDFYYLLNGSLYSATFIDEKGRDLNSRYNGNFLFNATVGKEWQREKKNRIAIFGINARFNYRGGFYETPINIPQSAEVGYTFYTDALFSQRQPDFYKLDLRLYWKRNKPKYSNTLALDIQNVTNRQNVAFNYYDTQQQQIVTKFQLGIIPILSYRIEF